MVNSHEITGWLLDLYPHPPGVVLWLLGEDGQRYRLHQPFPVTFYAAGPAPILRRLWRFLQDRPNPPALSRVERRDLFLDEPLPLLAAQASDLVEAERLFSLALAAFPELTYYDADIPLALRYAAVHHTFPLAHCRVEASEGGRVHAIEVLDSPWDLDPPLPPLRTLTMEPDEDPAHALPRRLHLSCERASYRLDLEDPRPLLINLRAIFQRHDPDLLLTRWGDTWLLPHLLELAEEWQLPLPLNRDESQEILFKKERSYFSYGQVIHRGRQVHLFGRWHLDAQNAISFDEYGLTGVFELARVTALPTQTAARVSPGSGISAMQVLTALRQGILVPWRKQQAEQPKTALDLIRSDQGGMVYQPVTGLHQDVAEIDFISMYPSIMAHFNISPETVGTDRPTSETAPELGLVVDNGKYGLVPATLQPLLQKRIAFKMHLAELPAWDPRRTIYKARASAHKWLLVTCFGYLGYKNARFGRIEAHEAVTAYGREALLRAKEAAEDLGFQVLHMYVDGLWVRKAGASRPADFQPLLESILMRTHLPVALDGIYRWVAFLPSRVDPRLPVPNRYFGIFQDGSLKMRGIEARRRDTPPFIAEMQVALIEWLGRLSPDDLAKDRRAALAPAIAYIRRTLADLRAGGIPFEKLLANQRLSRELEEYRTPSPAARAAVQLAARDRHLSPGQRVRFLYLRGDPGVHAWDLPWTPPVAALDVSHYTELLLRAAESALVPFGLSAQELRTWVLENVHIQALPLPKGRVFPGMSASQRAVLTRPRISDSFSGASIAWLAHASV